MSDRDAPSDRTASTTATRLAAAGASVAREAMILGLAGVWAVMWIALSARTLHVEGALDAVIIGVYSLAPVALIVGWRLEVHSRFNPPTFEDVVASGGSGDDGIATPADRVADRFTAGDG